MKPNLLPSSRKLFWQDNKPFVLFIASLLLILSLLKIIFYNYNYHFIFTAAGDAGNRADKFNMIKWSLAYDGFTLLLINVPFLIALQLTRLIRSRWFSGIIIAFFIAINSTVIILNLLDIFYFRFHFQRANADLLYVISHPFKPLFHLNIFILISLFISITGIILICRGLHRKFYNAFSTGKRGIGVMLLTVAIAVTLLMLRSGFTKLMVPNYPLLELNSRQLQVVQNSFHTFFYSVFRGGREDMRDDYMPVEQADSLFPLSKTLMPYRNDGTRKNIVLFIMESVPYDFFDPRSQYKVEMPFFDSLLQKSSFYSNAFCFAHQSNKGITAILAGLPTLTDIPLYHSPFVNLPMTAIGTALKKEHYHSFFCIGDDYDNFGFAKCTHWLGIDDYYSREDIPGSRGFPNHTMGLQDEYVLPFMHQKINNIKEPFFAINYNISTHYPYDLPAAYNKVFPPGYTAPMKSMQYYDHSLQQFFTTAVREPWFKNTVFIFCADHWLVPDDDHVRIHAVNSYRIPIIMYDPEVNEKKIITRMVSQFDVMGTILSVSGYTDSIISYGNSLTENNTNAATIITRPNANLYQALDTAYILGYNPGNDQAEYLYHYTTDTELKENLLHNTFYANSRNDLTKKILAFLQKASMQYHAVDHK